MAGRIAEMVRQHAGEGRKMVLGLATGSTPVPLYRELIRLHRDEGICVIALDTVMPGTTLNDFGDMIRTATNPAREDTKDLSQVRLVTSIEDQMDEMKRQLDQLRSVS